VARHRRWTDEQLIEAVRGSRSMRETLAKLGLNPTGANYVGVRGHMRRLAVEDSHFLGQAHLRGGHHAWAPKTPLDAVLVVDSRYTSTSHLKRRLIAAGVFASRCVECGLTEWRERPLSLVLDHINGNNRDHRIENLRLLCPNCHSQTSTFAGRNKGRRRIVPT